MCEVLHIYNHLSSLHRVHGTTCFSQMITDVWTCPQLSESLVASNFFFVRTWKWGCWLHFPTNHILLVSQTRCRWDGKLHLHLARKTVFVVQVKVVLVHILTDKVHEPLRCMKQSTALSVPPTFSAHWLKPCTHPIPIHWSMKSLRFRLTNSHFFHHNYSRMTIIWYDDESTEISYYLC